MKTAEKTTRTIAGHSITLQPGCRYWANRPMASSGRKVFDVSIILTDERGFAVLAEPVFIVAGMSLHAANQLLAAFNNGETSFEGRVWK